MLSEPFSPNPECFHLFSKQRSWLLTASTQSTIRHYLWQTMMRWPSPYPVIVKPVQRLRVVPKQLAVCEGSIHGSIYEMLYLTCLFWLAIGLVFRFLNSSAKNRWAWMIQSIDSIVNVIFWPGPPREGVAGASAPGILRGPRGPPQKKFKLVWKEVKARQKWGG